MRLVGCLGADAAASRPPDRRAARCAFSRARCGPVNLVALALSRAARAAAAAARRSGHSVATCCVLVQCLHGFVGHNRAVWLVLEHSWHLALDVRVGQRRVVWSLPWHRVQCGMLSRGALPPHAHRRPAAPPCPQRRRRRALSGGASTRSPHTPINVHTLCQWRCACTPAGTTRCPHGHGVVGERFGAGSKLERSKNRHFRGGLLRSLVVRPFHFRALIESNKNPKLNALGNYAATNVSLKALCRS